MRGRHVPATGGIEETSEGSSRVGLAGPSSRIGVMANQGMPGNFAGRLPNTTVTLVALTNVEHKLDCAREKRAGRALTMGTVVPFAKRRVLTDIEIEYLIDAVAAKGSADRKQAIALRRQGVHAVAAAWERQAVVADRLGNLLMESTSIEAYR